MTVVKNYRNDDVNGETVVGEAFLTIGEYETSHFWVGEMNECAPALPLKALGKLWFTGWDIPTRYAVDADNNCFMDDAHGGCMTPIKDHILISNAETDGEKNEIRKILGLPQEKTLPELYSEAQQYIKTLELALGDRMKLCVCRGTGTVEHSCVYCTGDSTYDHECQHRTSPCKAEGCILARNILGENNGKS
jgi:hypothetical protein